MTRTGWKRAAESAADTRMRSFWLSFMPLAWPRVLIFFFQAEDCIRDRDVTGVQTCALPIWLFVADNAGLNLPAGELLKQLPNMIRMLERSEERRVGKECRSRWSPAH